ncbi:MAG: ABC transporter substrate-binding protein, partial [Beijerinckiaceae bacterium]
MEVSLDRAQSAPQKDRTSRLTNVMMSHIKVLFLVVLCAVQLNLFGLAFVLASDSRKSEIARPREMQIIKVVTSFPGSTTEAFKRAFEKVEPQFQLQIVHRKTSAALAYVLAPDRPAADIFWASAPDAFEVLASLDKLDPMSRLTPLVQPRIGIFPIDDPEGQYLGFALSGYGIAYHKRRLEERGLPIPLAIEDLRRTIYHGNIGMSAPSRSGTTHLMVENLLQRQGWDAGWESWIEIAANVSSISARSFSVGRGLQQGRFTIALSIDFLSGRASSRENAGQSIAFV